MSLYSANVYIFFLNLFAIFKDTEESDWNESLKLSNGDEETDNDNGEFRKFNCFSL